MDINKEAMLLRIFISSTDKFKHSPLSEVIVFAAKRYGLAEKGALLQLKKHQSFTTKPVKRINSSKITK